MKNAWIRVLSLIVCGCMLLGLTVGGVSAEMSGITGVVPTDEYTFFDFEDFKEMCQDAAVFEETMICVYTGYVDFEIEDDIKIPRTVTLKTDGAGIRIPVGVTVELDGKLVGSGIQLEGTLVNLGRLELEIDDRIGLTVAQTGRYIDAECDCLGAIYVKADGESVPEQAISGMELSEFTAEKVTEGEDSFWKLTVTQDSGSGEQPDPHPGGNPSPSEPTEPDPSEPTEPDPSEPTEPDPSEPTEPDPSEPTEPNEDPDAGSGEEIVASGSLDGGLFTWTLDAQGTLTMSGRYIRTNIFDPSVHPWYNYREQVKKVVFEDTLEFIPEYACTGMKNLEEVTLSAGASYVGKHAFSGCESLAAVTIPAGMKEIREYAFSGCKSLKTLTFEQNSALETIGIGAFGENSIQQLTIPASVKTIGKEAFANSKELTTLVLQEGLETLGEHAFAYCGKLTGYLYLPSTLTTMAAAFVESMGFETVEVHCETFGKMSDGSETVKNVILGENVSAIADSGFANYTVLEAVEVKGALTSIGSDAFSECKNLASINLPEGLKAIGDSAFRSCNKLEEIQLPEGLETIGSRGFEYSGLTSVIIPDSVTEIGSWAFDHCDNLLYAEIGEGVEVLQNQFNDCPKLKLANIGNVNTIFGSFQNCASLTGITMWITNLERFQQNSFRNCDALEQFTFPASVKELGQLSFADCDSLEMIEFTGDAPQWISGSAFENVEAVAYYPAGNPTWTEEVRQKFGGTLTWKSVCESHAFTEEITEATCVQNGAVTHVCKYCEYSYVAEILFATGQHTYADENDADCNVCGSIRNLEIPTTPMYRLYNPNSGEHFYTGSQEERDMLIDAGWQYEGIAWNAPTKTGEPVYRLFNPNSGDHHYTMSKEERDMLVGYGWQYEGVCWNSAPVDHELSMVLYRLYNPNADCGSHHYTGSKEERDMLVGVGWIYEGTGWFGMIR